MLKTLQRLVEKHLFLKEEVTKSDVLNLSVRDQPSEYLPYLSFHERLPGEANDSNSFLNFDNTIGWVWELKPLAFLGNDKLDKLHSVIRSQFPKGTVTQWILFPDHNMDDYLRKYRDVRNTDDPITAMNVEAMETFIRQGVKGVEKMRNIPIRNFRLFLTVKNEKRISEELLVSLEQSIEFMEPRRWNASDMIKWASEFFSGKPSQGLYDANRPLRKQMSISNLDFSLPGSMNKIGNRFGICLFPNVVPQKNNNPLRTNELFGGFMGQEDDIRQIKSPFMFTLTVIYDDLKKNISDKATQTMFQRVGASLAAALNERIKEYAIMQNMIAQQSKFSYIIPQLWVFGDTEQDTLVAAGQAKSLWEGHDFEMMY
ncbi:TPA: TraC family protein, partial [Escherichia coli]|nr:TraC family protein [Escherichia coli]